MTKFSSFFKQFNNTRPETDNNFDNVMNSKYYSVNEITSLRIGNKGKSLLYLKTK